MTADARPREDPSSAGWPRGRWWSRVLLAGGLLAGALLFYLLGLHEYFNWEAVKANLASWQNWVDENPALALPLIFVVYVVVTGLSLPVAAVLSLVVGALLGRWLGTMLVSVAAVCGATLAFLSSRYLFRGWVRRRFGERLRKLDEGIARDGAFYLFSLRLVPIVPFFLINLGMGLTSIRLWTFVWVSWLGMLPGTFVYVNAGTELGKIESPADVLSPGVIVAFVLLGLAPLLFRLLVRWLRTGRASPT